jgi:hypothetical protein
VASPTRVRGRSGLCPPRFPLAQCGDGRRIAATGFDGLPLGPG